MKSVIKAAVSAVAAIVMSSAAFGGTVNFTTSNNIAAGVAYNQVWFAADPAQSGVTGYTGLATLWAKATAFSFSGSTLPTALASAPNSSSANVVLSSEGLGVQNSTEGATAQEFKRINGYKQGGQNLFNEAVKLDFFTGAYSAAAVAGAPTATAPTGLTSFGADISKLYLNKTDNSETITVRVGTTLTAKINGQTTAINTAVNLNPGTTTLDLRTIFGVGANQTLELLSIILASQDQTDSFTLSSISAEFGAPTGGPSPLAVPLPTAVWGGLALMGTIAARRRFLA